MTWSSEPQPTLVEDARRVAAKWALPVFERKRKAGLHGALGTVATAFLVRGGDGWVLVDEAGTLQVSPGLAMIRLKRLQSAQGVPDPLIDHAGVRPGDRIVDATFGLGADARVVASVAGPTGQVIGLEASKALAVLHAEGLPLERPWPGSAPIELLHSTASAWLRAQPDGSVDVIVFDPMFEERRASGPAFELLRRHAARDVVDAHTISEAFRVARRTVLMKSHSPEVFPALGLEPLLPSNNAVVFWGRKRRP